MLWNLAGRETETDRGSKRALISTRLSHFTDESTSIERQGEQGQSTAKARGEEVVYVAQDMDVSGAVSPFERADLGPWLTQADKDPSAGDKISIQPAGSKTMRIEKGKGLPASPARAPQRKRNHPKRARRAR